MGELTRAHGPADSEHQTSKGKRQENEELTMNSHRGLIQPERRQGARAAVEKGLGLGVIPKRKVEGG